MLVPACTSSISGDGTFRGAFVAAEQGFFRAAMAEDVMAQVAGDAFGAAAPEQDSFVNVDYAKAGRQIFEDGAADFRIVEGRHESARKLPRLGDSSAKIHRTSSRGEAG